MGHGHTTDSDKLAQTEGWHQVWSNIISQFIM